MHQRVQGIPETNSLSPRDTRKNKMTRFLTELREKQLNKKSHGNGLVG
jgi:hypothetical protein